GMLPKLYTIYLKENILMALMGPPLLGLMRAGTRMQKAPLMWLVILDSDVPKNVIYIIYKAIVKKFDISKLGLYLKSLFTNILLLYCHIADALIFVKALYSTLVLDLDTVACFLAL
ncbi:hypothetical protein ACJX0J_021424, partial [Zea mays]